MHVTPLSRVSACALTHMPLSGEVLVRQSQRSILRPSQQLRQLGDVGGDAPGLVLGQQVVFCRGVAGRRLPSCPLASRLLLHY